MNFPTHRSRRMKGPPQALITCGAPFLLTGQRIGGIIEIIEGG